MTLPIELRDPRKAGRIDMQSNVSPDIQDRSELEASVAGATHLLEEIMGHTSMSRATADWSLIRDPSGRDLVRLLVSDWTGAVAYVFAPEELKDSDQMKYRLHRLWGDLLQVSSHVLFDGILGEVQPEGAR